jgi:hypothetical protein
MLWQCFTKAWQDCGKAWKDLGSAWSMLRQCRETPLEHGQERLEHDCASLGKINHYIGKAGQDLGKVRHCLGKDGQDLSKAKMTWTLLDNTWAKPGFV